MLFKFDSKAAGIQFVEDFVWVRRFNIHYGFGVDGIAALLLFLTTLLGVIVIIASWNYVKDRERGFFVSLLLLQTGMSGVFLLHRHLPLLRVLGGHAGADVLHHRHLGRPAADLRGHQVLPLHARRQPAHAGGHHRRRLLRASSNTGRAHVQHPAARARPYYPYYLQFWAFAAFFLAFAIKVPMFPLHTWLPDAHVEAPTAGSVILAGVLLKMGGYGMLRFCLPMFPEAAVDFAPWVIVLSVVAIIYGALVAMMQKDLKKLVAYSSVSHMGFVTAGIFAAIADGRQPRGHGGRHPGHVQPRHPHGRPVPHGRLPVRAHAHA